MIDKTDTIAAIATAPGKGGIGIVRISGPRAARILNTVTGKQVQPRQAVYCSFTGADGDLIDRGIALFFSGPASCTGEDTAELQGHGGQVVLNRLLEETLKLGARAARPGEFTERAFLNGKLDLLQAEAVADLIDSASAAAARGAMRSLAGDFSDRIQELKSRLAEARLFIEGALDFPEEEIDFIKDPEINRTLNEGLAKTRELIRQAGQGRVFREGISLVIVGPPNVGKSSLLNAMAKVERAIVTDIPGTTRDTLEDRIIIDGIPVYIVDTAGLRNTTDVIEEEGIRRAKSSAREADLLIHMLEAGNEALNRTAIDIAASDQACITLYNKIDLSGDSPGADEISATRSQVYLSVKTGEGMQYLVQEIRRLSGLDSDGDSPISGRSRHVDALQRTAHYLGLALEKSRQDKPPAELLAEDLRQAQHSLEIITGESTPDDLLGDIFSRFCIGK